MKTHKVVDVIDGTDDALYYGTEEECYEWKRQQGFGYKVVTLSKEERVLANERFCMYSCSVGTARIIIRKLESYGGENLMSYDGGVSGYYYINSENVISFSLNPPKGYRVINLND